MCDARATSTYCSAASDHDATSYDRAAPVNSAAIIDSPTAILVSRVTIAAAIVGAAAGYDCSAADNRSTAIYGTTPNSTMSDRSSSVDAATSDGPGLSLQSLATDGNPFEGAVWKH